MSTLATTPPRPAGFLTFHWDFPSARWPTAVPAQPRIPAGEPTAPCRKAEPESARWVPLGDPAELGHGLVAPRGGLYIGDHLTPLDPNTSFRVAACLIRPALPVDRAHPDDGGDIGPWPSYSTLDARSRAGFLRFLSHGAQHPQAPVGFVFLFFYGLERRLLLNLARTTELQVQQTPFHRELQALHAERVVLTAEVRRLLTAYERHTSIRRYLPALLDVAAWADAPQPGAAPPDTDGLSAARARFCLALGLGRLAAFGSPLPAAWAFAWWRADKATAESSALRRCPAQFQELFERLYTDRHGDGLVLPEARQRLSVFYPAASPDLPTGRWVRTDAQDVTRLATPVTELASVATETTAKLRSYSRHLASQPGQTAPRSAFWLLPAELRAADLPDAADLAAWARQRLDGRAAGTARLQDLAEVWTGDPCTQVQVGELRAALRRHGLDVQVDVRVATDRFEPGSRVALLENRCRLGISRSAHSAQLRPTVRRGGPAVVTVEELATVLETLIELLATSGALDADQVTDLTELVAEELPTEQRLALHGLAALIVERPLAAPVLYQRLRDLGTAARQGLDRLVGHLARPRPGGEGTAHRPPGQQRGLDQDLRRLLEPVGRPPTRRASAAKRADAQLVSVRLSGQPAAVHELPDIPEIDGGSDARGVLLLDPVRVQAVHDDTHVVTGLLAAIFDEDEPVRGLVDDGAVPAVSSAAVGVAGSDAGAGSAMSGAPGPDEAHRALLCALNARSSWSRSELADVASELGLLLGAALEQLNDSALDLTGDCVTEGHDPLRVNTDILEEIRDHRP